MVVPDKNDANLGYLLPVDAGVFPNWHVIVCRLENKTHATVEIHSELARSVALQWVWPPGDEVGYTLRSNKVGKVRS